ncbi:MFS transporter [Chromobacterium phragmitis]|uniref:MFS transporter n=1 Tax=Chromobacterium phragmitis TaxID=2202141 RepID=A0A344UCP4_9NEIS|nr:nitrate/nitrite transporter [Chromobacterium phragmitis]AXE31715.1 MFS transporter [Chromobacterium phragmitis]AXE33042.1 MFS transporter [Chromobacterium phragmitis]
MDRTFWQAGHRPTLISAFLYFDLSFMVWYLLGPLQVPIAAALQLSAQQRGFVVATPILAGALLRPLMGLLVDRIGAKRAGLLGQVVVVAALFGAWALDVSSLAGLLSLGALLGVAGASFAAALPLASRWYPPRHQGTAMGIAGAGNSGTVLAALFAPALAAAYGWQNVFGLACLPLLLALLVYAFCAREAPSAPPPKRVADYLAVLRERDAWCFMFFYAMTFGGFSGFASALPGYFHDQFGFDAKTAGLYTAACVFAGSAMRPLGGMLADRLGGTRSLSGVYLACALLIGAAAQNAGGPAWALWLFVAAMLCLGAGNGAVFQLVPLRFGRELGVMTGLVGMAGGIGGFALAAGLGVVKQASGGYGPGLWLFAVLSLLAWLGLAGVQRQWRNDWAAAAARV